MNSLPQNTINRFQQWDKITFLKKKLLKNKPDKSNYFYNIKSDLTLIEEFQQSDIGTENLTMEKMFLFCFPEKEEEIKTIFLKLISQKFKTWIQSNQKSLDQLNDHDIELILQEYLKINSTQETRTEQFYIFYHIIFNLYDKILRGDFKKINPIFKDFIHNMLQVLPYSELEKIIPQPPLAPSQKSVHETRGEHVCKKYMSKTGFSKTQLQKNTDILLQELKTRFFQLPQPLPNELSEGFMTIMRYDLSIIAHALYYDDTSFLKSFEKWIRILNWATILGVLYICKEFKENNSHSFAVSCILFILQSGLYLISLCEKQWGSTYLNILMSSNLNARHSSYKRPQYYEHIKDSTHIVPFLAQLQVTSIIVLSHTQLKPALISKPHHSFEKAFLEHNTRVEKPLNMKTSYEHSHSQPPKAKFQKNECPLFVPKKKNREEVLQEMTEISINQQTGTKKFTKENADFSLLNNNTSYENQPILIWDKTAQFNFDFKDEVLLKFKEQFKQGNIVSTKGTSGIKYISSNELQKNSIQSSLFQDGVKIKILGTLGIGKLRLLGQKGYCENGRIAYIFGEMASHKDNSSLTIDIRKYL
jgi:hypothetical protein